MRAALACVACVLSIAAVAHAGPEDDALAHLDRGIAAYRAGDYAGARDEFEAARALVPDKANPYRWLGLAEVQLGDCPRAIADLDRFLALAPAGDPRAASVQRLRDACAEGPQPLGTPPTAPLPEPAPRPPPPPPSRSITQRWWFWPVVGGAAVVAAGAAFAIAFRAPGEPTLPGVTCGASGCAP